jgi:adenosylcobinamide-GDP ribazoletransferase
MKGFITAMRTLTIIPVPGKEVQRFSSSLFWFPGIGFIIGIIIYGLGWLWIKLIGTDWPGGGAAILLIAQVILTRGLHFDGLADWADALGGKRDKTVRLAIMKDPRVGAFGVIALVIVFLAKWVAIERMLSTGSLIWVVCIMVISRDMMVELMTTLPYARSEEGMATPFVKDSSLGQKIGAHIFCLILCLLAGPTGLLFYGLGWGITRLLKTSYVNDFGGISGDLLGATNEIVEMILLLLCAANAGLIMEYTGWDWLQKLM